jgi:AcrR family transcriptional regulator
MEQAILDAAERVVGRDGAANLTLDAVAKEAGVNKASVIYDHKSKQALIEAIVDRAFKRDNDAHAAIEDRICDPESLAIKGRIAAAAEPPPDAFRAVALNLSAVLTLDAGLRTKMQANQSIVIARILASSSEPRGAMLAYLALEGLKFLENLDFHHFEREGRDRILREINWLATMTPEEVALPPIQSN